MHRRFRGWLTGCALVLACSSASSLAPLTAQTPAPAAPPIWRGVYTDAQAARGREAYGNSCVGCHNRDLTGSRTGPALSGAPFMTKWESQNLLRVYRIIRETMPRNNPGTLNDQTAVDLLALILQTNGLPAGPTELRAGADVLETLAIVAKEGPTQKEVPNFALVQTVGCLVEEAPRSWRLTKASDVAATKDAPPSEADLKAAAAGGGALTLRLLSVLPFKPEAARGQRVLLKGIINRYPGEVPLVNVTGLHPVGVSCGG